MNNQDNWISKIVDIIAKEHNIIIDKDDPILVTVLLNDILMKEYYEKQEILLNKHALLIKENQKIQSDNNLLVLQSVVEKLTNMQSNKLVCNFKETNPKNNKLPVVVASILGLFVGFLLKLFI